MIKNPNSHEDHVELLKRILELCNPHIQSAIEIDDEEEKPSTNPRVHLKELWYNPKLWDEWRRTPAYRAVIWSYLQDIKLENIISAQFIEAGWFAWTMGVPKAMMVNNASSYLNKQEESQRENRKELRDMTEIEERIRKLWAESSMRNVIKII